MASPLDPNVEAACDRTIELRLMRVLDGPSRWTIRINGSPWHGTYRFAWWAVLAASLWLWGDEESFMRRRNRG